VQIIDTDRDWNASACAQRSFRLPSYQELEILAKLIYLRSPVRKTGIR
jgi:hypothetical protein